MGKWRFLDTGESRGSLNMAVDEAILNVKGRGLTPPTLRVFRWSPPALSLGRLQDTEDIDFEKCKELGIEVCRRPTGAGAILHKEELTYSVVASKKDGIPLSLRESHEIINRGIVAAYKILGVEIELITSSKRNKSALCFLATGLTDLTYQGKKLIGSVWMRRDTGILQHGSLIIKHEPEILFSILRFPSGEIREKTFEDFRGKTTSLSEISKEITCKALKEALFKGFQTALGIEFFEGELTPEEIAEAKRLMEVKYERKTS